MVYHTPFLSSGPGGLWGDGDGELSDGVAPVISQFPHDEEREVGLLSCVH